MAMPSSCKGVPKLFALLSLSLAAKAPRFQQMPAEHRLPVFSTSAVGADVSRPLPRAGHRGPVLNAMAAYSLLTPPSGDPSENRPIDDLRDHPAVSRCLAG